MQFSSGLIFMGASGLALAAPSQLMARSSSSNSCGLTNYQDATEGPIADGISYLLGHAENQPPTAFWTTPNGCTLISESYGTGFQLCETLGNSDPYEPSALGNLVNELVTACVGEGGVNGGGSNLVHAMQHWEPKYNILVRGGF